MLVIANYTRSRSHSPTASVVLPLHVPICAKQASRFLSHPPDISKNLIATMTALLSSSPMAIFYRAKVFFFFHSFYFRSLLCSIPAYLSPQESTFPAAAANLHLRGLFSPAHVAHFTKVHVLISAGSLCDSKLVVNQRLRFSQLENASPKPRGAGQPCHKCVGELFPERSRQKDGSCGYFELIFSG